MSTAWWDKIGEKDNRAPEDFDPATHRATSAIILGGIVAGSGDLTYAVAFYSGQGVMPIRILQSIASGLLGADSYQLGWASAILGIVLHFLFACSAAAIYYLGSRKLRILLSRAPLCGAVYGAVIYFFMRKVVLPLSAAPEFKSTGLSMWLDLAVHVFLIGLPIALIVRHYRVPFVRQPHAADGPDHL